MNPRPPRQNTKAELEAFDRCCERLAGFDPGISFEWVDGFLAALAAGPRLAPPDEWLPALCGDAFERAFADPEDHTRGLQALQARLKVLCDQLDPEALLDAPDWLRLDPLIAEVTDEDRRLIVEEEGLSVDEAAAFQTGSLWAEGFFDGVEAFADLWTEPADEEAAELFKQAFDQIAALLPPPGSDEWQAHLASHYPKGEPTRDELLAEACMAVQDLRLFWVDFAPRPETRRVEPTPGRNEACPCGSGKKYKKCHGAT
ncbi:MAG: YecA family protein [Leptothrix sp. (in: Bacteria)]|nr:YecA family protein [Leptothrix sp. (in: b-proteobacteria)]